MAILFLTVLICLWISHELGLWDPAKTGVGNFWSIGYFTDDQPWVRASPMVPNAGPMRPIPS